MKLRIITVGLAVLLLNSGYVLAEESTEVKSTDTSVTEEGAGDKAAHKYCLVCGPEEETETLGVSYKYKGKKYSFCRMDCLKAFKANPEKYISESGEKLEMQHNEDKGSENHAGHDHHDHEKK